MDSTDLTAELHTLAAAGFGGVEITPIYGVHGYESAFIPYLSPAWIHALLVTSRAAAQLRMGVDMPPGSGWRMGGPGVPADEASANLDISRDTVRGGAQWVLDSHGRQVDAVVAVAEDGRKLDLTRQVTPAGELRWSAPPGRWTVYVAETRFSGDRVKRPAPGGEGYAIDVFSRRAVADYLERYDQALRRVPHGTLDAWFHDSFEYTGNGSHELFATFRARRGYDLATQLPALAGVGSADTVARVKADYRATLDDMLLDNFMRPLTAWAHGRGALMREQAHGSPGNILDLYAASDIPETEIIFGRPRADDDPLMSKFASSAAHVAGRKLASAESFTWLAEHFQATLDDVKHTADVLFLGGIDRLVYHGTAYSPASAPWPGWQFYASTEFNPRSAIWHDLPALNAYVRRVQSVLQAGRPGEDVLLYWPIQDNWHDTTGLRMDFKVGHRPPWLLDKPVGTLATTLWHGGWAFDYVSDRQLAGSVAASAAGLSAAGTPYRAILVPPVQHMPVETLERLLALARAGGSVAFVGALPADVPGLGALEARRARLRALEGEIRFGAADARGVRTAALGRGRVLLAPGAPELLQAAGAAREPMTDQGLRFLRRRSALGHDYFVANTGDGPVDGWVPLGVSATAVAILDPMDGRAGLARVRSGANGQADVFLQLDPGQSLLLRTSRTGPEGSNGAWHYRRPQGAPVALRGRWQVSFLEGGPSLPAPFETDTLPSWTARDDSSADRFAGTARYTLTFDAPGDAPDWLLDLGRVAESARVRLNGRELGTLFAQPFRVETGPLRRTGNVLEVEVTNLSANRIRDLDRRDVRWKNFYDINFVNMDYKPFDASAWPLRDSGLLGPVRLQALADGGALTGAPVSARR